MKITKCFNLSLSRKLYRFANRLVDARKRPQAAQVQKLLVLVNKSSSKEGDVGLSQAMRNRGQDQELNMPIIIVSRLLPEDMQTILTETPLKLGECYRASFDLVFRRRIAEKYVLGFATNKKDNIATPHAWIKSFDGRYADPVLQHNDYYESTKYEYVIEMTRDELETILCKKYGENFDNIITNPNGYFPPALDIHRNIIFE